MSAAALDPREETNVRFLNPNKSTNVRESRPSKSTNVRATAPWGVDIAYVLARLLAGAAPAIASRLAFEIFTRPRRFPRPDREVTLLSQARPDVLPLGLQGLPAWTWGQGPRILLVHGWEGRGAQLGPLVAPLVEAGFSVTTFDAPAHGDADGNQATLVSFADAIHAADRRYGPFEAVIAHSMGGAATLMAARDGLRTERIALIAAPDAAQAPGRFVRFLGLPTSIEDGLMNELATRYGFGAEAFATPTVAPQVTQPVLVVHDEDDRFVPYADGVGIADAAPDTHLVTTSGLGHHRVLRDPGVVDAIRTFLDKGRS